MKKRDVKFLFRKRDFGHNSPSNKIKPLIFFIFSFVIFFCLILILSKIDFTGKVSMDLLSSYSLGENIKGNLVLKLKPGELIPSNSLIKVSLGNQEREIPLSSILNLTALSGDYYSENVQLNGSGEGYGFIGEKSTYPPIDFSLLLTKDTLESETGISSEEEIEEETPFQDNLTEVVYGDSQNEPSEKIDETNLEPVSTDEEPSENGLTLTGNVIENEETKEIKASVSKGNAFSYILGEGEKIELLEGSVKDGEEVLDDSTIQITQKGNEIIITTEYEKTEEGFGEEFLGKDEQEIEIDLSKLNITAEQGELTFSLENNNQEILFISHEIKIDDVAILENLTNETEAPVEEITINETLPNLTNETIPLNLTNETLLENLTNETVIIFNVTNLTQENLTIQTIQYQARIGEPVKWKKIINKSEGENVTIDLPQDTFNISVKKVEDKVKEEVDGENIQISGLTGNVALEYQDKPVKPSGILQRFFAWLGLSGNVVEEINLTNETPIENETSQENKIEENITDSVQVEITDNSTNLEIEYYTEAPTATETNLTNGKQIIVSAPDELNYTNILAYTELNEKIQISSSDKINLYWLTNETTQENETQNPIPLQRVKVTFTYFDWDEDGFIDYIEWIVPHLSNQTYELIIKIKDAEHLDENRSLIENVYDYVKEKDNNWITIPDGHYLRLKFETNLTSSRDITLYVKSSNENFSRIEVYETNQTQLISSFENITNESYYKIYLTNLTNSQDSFDLKVINSVDFDYVVDPIDSVTINYPTNTSDNPGSNIIVNASITGTSVDSCLTSLNGQANVTMLLNGEKSLANYTYINLASGYHNLTVYCNDTSNAFNSATTLNFFVNLPPNVTSVVLFPSSTDKNQNLTCNFTITDDNPNVIWGEKNKVFGYSRIISFFCDSDFCYSGDESGYFLKINKTSGAQIYNRTTGYTNRPSSNSFYSLFCDSDFCYGGSYSSFLKLNKTSGVHIYNTTTGYTNQLSTSWILSLYCDSDFCYGGDSSGYFLKLNKTSGVHIYNRTTGYTNQLSVNAIYALSCDLDFCYGTDEGGYFLKINKTSGAQIYNRTTGYTNQLSNYGVYFLYCDPDFCYGGDNNGYFLKVNKTSGVQIWNTTSGYINRPSSYIRGLTCDSDFCYARDSDGYFLKLNKTSGVHIWNTTSGYKNKISSFGSAYMVPVSCDSEFCYTSDDSLSLLKVRKNKGETLFSNITWYKNGVSNLTYQLEGVFNNFTKNTTLPSGNFTRGDNWTCSVTAYDTKSYGEAKNSSSSLILNTPPVLNWLQINPSYYVFSNLSSYASFFDTDSDNLTLYFNWFINGTSVRNDTILNVQSNIFTTSYLNVNFSKGDVINVSVYANDGLNNSQIYWFNKSIWKDTPWGKGYLYPFYCDNRFCYSGDNYGYFLKINKTSGVQIWNKTDGYTNRLSSYQITGVSCDADFCYAADTGGYFFKINKTSGVHIWNTTSGYINKPVGSGPFYSLFCDSDFCYGVGGYYGYFLKINKTSGVHIWNTTTGYTNQLSTTHVYSLYCDSDFCYGLDKEGYFLKINKTSGVHIYNRTIGFDKILGGTNYYDGPKFGLYCDSNYCYTGDASSYLLKINKTSGVQIWNKTTGYTYQMTNRDRFDLYCDSNYCYGGDYGGYFLQIDPNSGAQVYGSTNPFQLSSNTLYGTYCDDDFCYLGDRAGNINKVLKSNSIIIKETPVANFSSPTLANGNYPLNEIIAKFDIEFPETNSINVTLYNSSGLVNSSFLSNAFNYPSFLINFSDINNGIYYLNGSISYAKGITGIIETRKITLDNAAPIFLNKLIYDIEEGVSIDLSIPFLDFSPISLWEVNDTGHFSISSLGTLSNLTPFSKGENYTLNITATDILGYSNSTTLTINTIKASNSSIGLNLLFPLTNFSISQNKTFVVGVNVSCHQEDCGEVQVSLDPPTLNNYTFTTCSQIGRLGPNQSQCDLQYNTTSLQNKVRVYQGYQYFNITSTGAYLIETYGAKGGSQPEYNVGGKGAKISGIFNFKKGDQLILVIGQNGTNSIQNDGDGGGGGGTFLTIVNESSSYVLFDGNHVTPLIIAGGGGGDGSDSRGEGASANTTSTGYFPNNGNGFGGNHTSGGSGGGGFITNGRNYTSNLGGGQSFLNGANGGLNSSTGGAAIGGFGGGAGANDEYGAGGGGWNGGVGYDGSPGSGGGGSYNIGSNQSNLGNISNSGLLNLFQLTSISKDGLLSTDDSSTPFYSLNDNPAIFNLSLGESKIVSWRVNTTGNEGESTFFVYANKTSRMFTSNITSSWDVAISNIQDTTSPKISIIYPQNNSFNAQLASINYSVYDPYLQTCWYSNDSLEINTTLFRCENLTSIIWSEGQHNVTIWAEDINNNENHSSLFFTIDTTNPLINFSSQTPENMTLINDNFTIYTNVSETNLANITLNWNGTLTHFNRSSSNIILLGGNNLVFAYNQTGILANKTYFYQINVSDLAGNKNATEVRFVKGSSAPTYISVSQSPNATDYNNLDPLVNFTVNVNISDIDGNFDSAILQWRNSSGSEWINITMINLTEKKNYTLMQAVIPALDYEDNFTYRIWSNETTGKSSLSNNFTIASFWDCSWVASLSTNQVAGWSENKQVANFIINNTGDPEYAQDNCTLLFHLSHDLSAGRIYFNNWNNNRWQKYYDTPQISAKSNLTIPLNVTFFSEILQETAKISTLEIMGISNSETINNSLVVLSNQEGPYLYQEISSYPSQGIDLTSNSFNLQAYLRNIMGSIPAIENNTAYNLSFYWVLPSELEIISGDSSKELSNLSDNIPVYLDSEVGFSDLASTSPGVKSVFLYGLGFNGSGDLIRDVSNQSILSNSVNLTFSCYNTSDGVYVTACGSLDGDYVAPEVTVISNGGGGGGSGGGVTSNIIEKKADFQFVRGKTNEIKLSFKNDFNSSLTSLRFSLTGNLSKYIKISPSELSALGPFEETGVLLDIVSPGFIPLGKQVLVLNIVGKRGSDTYTEKRTIILQVNDLSKEEAEEILYKTNALFGEIAKENLSLPSLSSLNKTIYASYENLDFNSLQDSFNTLQNLVTSALNSESLITELTGLVSASEEKQIDVSKTKRLLNLAQLSFSRKEFSETLARLKEAQITFALETKGSVPSLFYYLKYKTKESILVLIFSLISFILILKLSQNLILTNKIKSLKGEEKIIQSLIKDSQKKTFLEKKTSIEDYHQSMDYFEKRLSEIVQTLIDKEKQKENLLKFNSKEKSLVSEKNMIVNKLKEIQTDYLKKKNIDKRTYDIMMESYTSRLSQVEELIADIEAKKTFKKEVKVNLRNRRNKNV